MTNLPSLTDIPEEEQTPLVKALVGLLEQYATRIVLGEKTVAGLKDEINALKSEKKRPDFKRSGMDKGSDRKPGDAGKKGDVGRQRAGSSRKSRNAQLTIHQDVNIAPSTPNPPGSRFKGYRDFVVRRSEHRLAQHPLSARTPDYP